MPWILAGVVLFLIFATKTGGAKAAQQPLPTGLHPSPNSGGTAGAGARSSVVTPVAASSGGLLATLGTIYQYGSKIWNYAKTAYQGYTYVSKAISTPSDVSTVSTIASEGDTATGIDATVNAGLSAPDADTAAAAIGVGAAAGEGLTATGEIAGTTVSYVAGAGSETVAAVVGEAAAGVIGTVGIGVGFLALGFVVEELVNLGLNDYKTGQLSKEIMRQKQIYIMQHGSEAIENAIAAAATFADAMNVLARAPQGTSGQVQFGIGNEYAGMHLEPGKAGTTETPQWSAIVKAMGDPQTLRDHPEAIANFVANLWVQTGPGGQTIFDQHSTFLFRLNLLSKLPYTPVWNYVKTIILNMPMVDPRNLAARDAAIASVPIPPEDQYLRLGWAKIDTTRIYKYYNIYTSPPRYEASSPEVVAYNLAAIDPNQEFQPYIPSVIPSYAEPITVGGD